MKILTITIFAFALVAFGWLQVQGKSIHDTMDKSGDMTSSQSMSTDEMKTSADEMKMSTGEMKMPSKEMKMPADDMMKEDNMTMPKETKMMTPVEIPSDAELREQLTPLQYKVTRENGTEPAFSNAYWNNHEPGIYVDIISGVPLFSSKDKYDSGTGWPSFTRPIALDRIVEKEDHILFYTRTEVRGKASDSHLGHVFDDGPQPTGLRYCMNSAALRFIPAADLEKEGYGEYAMQFK